MSLEWANEEIKKVLSLEWANEEIKKVLTDRLTPEEVQGVDKCLGWKTESPDLNDFRKAMLSAISVDDVMEITRFMVKICKNGYSSDYTRTVEAMKIFFGYVMGLDPLINLKK